MNTVSRMPNARAVILAIDRYEHGAPIGRLYLPRSSSATEFQGVLQMLQEVESAMDAMDLPRSFGTMRSFLPSPPAADPAQDSPPIEGLRATFQLQLLFRQNASWQGSVTWVEGRQEQSFRSVLELLLLMAGALNGTSTLSA